MSDAYLEHDDISDFGASAEFADAPRVHWLLGKDCEIWPVSQISASAYLEDFSPNLSDMVTIQIVALLEGFWCY